jgi:DNA primase
LARFKRRKEDWQGFCPIHQSKTNNNCFAYHDSGKFHCFSCNAKGDGAIDMAMAVKDIGFQAAVGLLQPFVGQAAQTPAPAVTPAPDANSSNPRPLEKDTWRQHQVPCEWLEKRIPDAAVRERYGVFCYNNRARKSAYSGRVMLPVKDINGQLFGYLWKAGYGKPGTDGT